MVSQVSHRQSRIVLSNDLEARSRPSAEKETDRTVAVCPSSRYKHFPVTGSHTRTVASNDAEASMGRCGGDHARWVTRPVCPRRFCKREPVSVFQKRIV